MSDACIGLALGLVLFNLGAGALVALDKRRARSRPARRRVPHATLRLLALLGAAPGLLVSMRLVRHKTRRPGLLATLFLLGLAGLAAWALLLHLLGCWAP